MSTRPTTAISTPPMNNRPALRHDFARLLPPAVRFVVTAVMLFAFAGGARADETTPWTVIYGDTSTNVPKKRTWNGTSWTSESSTLDIGGSPRWAVLRNCPVRNELISVFSDNQNDLNAYVFNGSAWGNLVEASINLVTTSERPFYAAYEQVSGDGLLMYRVNSVSTLYYRTWNGSAWSSQGSTTSMGTGDPKWIKMIPKSNSNEIMIVVLDNSSDLTAMTWDGSAFTNKILLDSSVAFDGTECVDAAYERSSGRCVVSWSTNGTSIPKYRILNGSSWLTAANMPDVGGNAKWIRLASDPTGNKLIAMTLDGSSDVNVCVWNGSAWGAMSEFESNVPDSGRRCCDVAFEPAGTRALAMYGRSGQDRAYYRVYDGSGWASETAGPNLSQPVSVIQFAPASSGQEVLIGIERKNDGAFTAMRWDGASIVDYAVLASDLAGPNDNESFMFSDPTRLTLVPANIPYFTDFQSTVGPEWSTTVTDTNGTFTKFLGRFGSTQSATLALNTTPGETYELTFDLYTIDSWNGDDTSNGPDHFDVTVGGSVLFHQTLTNRPTTRPFSYPYPADSWGSYGYDSGYDDGVFRSVAVSFTASSATTQINFKALGLQDIDNESWGIDNVSVQTARFVDVSIAKGFDAQSSTSAANYGGGVAWADLDGDGDLDAVLSGNTARLLVSNNAGASFTSSLLGDFRRQWALLDVENDGDMDLWTGGAASYDAESCRRNNGPASFSNGGDLGFSNPSSNEGLSAADVNGDGWCDIVMFSTNGNWIGRHTGSASPVLAGSNDVADGLNDSGDFGDGDYCSAGDVNNDGYVDFFHHYGSGKLFVSDGDGSYTQNNYNIGVSTGSSKKIGSAWADYDNDGDLDLFCARYDETCTGYLWRNDRNWTAGSGNFTNATTSAGFNLNTVYNCTPDIPGTRSCAWGDYDNDGDLDLFIIGPNGNNYLYQNQGGGAFLRRSEGTTLSGAFMDGAFVDYDNDGDLDLCLTKESGTSVLLENRVNNGNYLKVRVLGAGAGKTNRAAIGTRVELWNAAGTTLLARRDIGVARGFGGTEPLWAHFGGVTPASTYQVKVYFRGGVTTTTLVPASTSTMIGSTVIPKMLTVQENGTVKLLKWIEVQNRAS